MLSQISILGNPEGASRPGGRLGWLVWGWGLHRLAAHRGAGHAGAVYLAGAATEELVDHAEAGRGRAEQDKPDDGEHDAERAAELHEPVPQECDPEDGANNPIHCPYVLSHILAF